MTDREKEDAWKYAEISLIWSGCGSPIGLGFFIVAIGVTTALIRYVWVLH
jgi:hypothetical protein